MKGTSLIYMICLCSIWTQTFSTAFMKTSRPCVPETLKTTHTGNMPSHPDAGLKITVSKRDEIFRSRDHMTSQKRKETKAFKPAQNGIWRTHCSWRSPVGTRNFFSWLDQGNLGAPSRKVPEVSGYRKLSNLTSLQTTSLFVESWLSVPSCPWAIPVPVPCGIKLQTWTNPLSPSLCTVHTGAWQSSVCLHPKCILRYKSLAPSDNKPTHTDISRTKGCRRSFTANSIQTGIPFHQL